MKRKVILSLSFLIVFLAILWSCHNEDFTKGETNPQRNNTNFFKHSQKGGMNARAGVDYVAILEAYNRETDFLSKMPDQRGMPIWDKMQVVDTEQATGLMIPLSYDNETMSSVLFVTLDDKNSVTGVKDYDNTMLKDIVYNEGIDIKLREQMFFTFMYMDNKTFGTILFTNAPEGILDEMKFDKENGRILIKDFEEPKPVHSESSKILFFESCGLSWSCKNHETWSKCDHCPACYSTSCNTIMVYIPDESFPGSPGLPGGGGGGGGGTPGSGTPPKDPCTLSTDVFYRLAPGCNGGGVNPDLPSLDDPCQKTNDMLARPNVQQGIANVKSQALQTLSNINAGETGFKEKKDGTVVPADVNSAHQVVFNNVTDGYGGYHNHTATGTHMFSPPDIVDTLFGFASSQSINDGVGNAYFGMIAAEWCNTCPNNVQYIHYIISYSGTGTELGGYVYTPAQMNQFLIDYRKKVNKLLKDPLNSNNNGASLNNVGLEKLFFDTLKNIGLNGKVNLQRVESNGIVKNITENSNGTINATPCP
ncbi:hypothetical protein [Chryseobacterium lineare]